MKDPDPLPLLKKMVVQAVESCTDADLLDLIYRLTAQEITLAPN
jgi:hypothetical protein